MDEDFALFDEDRELDGLDRDELNAYLESV